jgi:HAD superfamily hydrolase (TIGR01509 family)
VGVGKVFSFFLSSKRDNSSASLHFVTCKFQTSLKLLIFDLDGTLMDSVGAVEAAANRVRERKNLGDVDRQLVESVLSDPNAFGGETTLLVEASADGKERRDALMLFGRYLDVVFNDYAFPYPDVPETLQILKNKGFKLVVVSNRITLFLHQWLEYAGLVHFFDLVVGIDMVESPPPAPDVVQYALRFMEAAPHEALLVADSMMEIEAAKAAGVATVFAHYGYGTALDTDFNILNFKDLLEIIK